MLKVPDGTLRILVQGGQRVRIDELVARASPTWSREIAGGARRPRASRPSSRRSCATSSTTFSDIIEQVPYLPEELQIAVANVDDPERARPPDRRARCGSRPRRSRRCSRSVDVAKRLRRLSEILARELEVISLGSKIQSQVQSEMDKTQREYFLRQQLKAIQEELGEADEIAGRGQRAARAARRDRPARGGAQAGRPRARRAWSGCRPPRPSTA